MKKIFLVFSIAILIAFFSENMANSYVNHIDKEITFLTKYNKTTWTNGFSNYTFNDTFSQSVDVVLPICDTCVIPSLECHMCGYSWMQNNVGEFSFGTNYNNDFFYEEDYTRFFEDSNFTIWSINFRAGYGNEYKSEKIQWIKANSDSTSLHKIRLKNKPVLDLYQIKKDEEHKLIGIEFDLD
tara:strand:- start:3199 stop:3747 length:549 start_codon:yes stop_codon:yes gene_type:complete